MSNGLEINPRIVSLPQLKQKQFVLCNNCFWIAESLGTRQFDIDVCPLCKNPVSSLPITDNETYRYNYTPSRGVELEFSSSR